MTQAKRDDNFIPVGLGFDDTNSVTKPLLVDPSTGRLLITVSAINNGSPTKQSQPGKRDDNFVPVSLAVDDDGTAAVVPLHIDAASGLLSVDLIL